MIHLSLHYPVGLVILTQEEQVEQCEPIRNDTGFLSKPGKHEPRISARFD
jgi:hypothetical protein